MTLTVDAVDSLAKAHVAFDELVNNYLECREENDPGLASKHGYIAEIDYTPAPEGCETELGMVQISVEYSCCDYTETYGLCIPIGDLVADWSTLADKWAAEHRAAQERIAIAQEKAAAARKAEYDTAMRAKYEKLKALYEPEP